MNATIEIRIDKAQFERGRQAARAVLDALLDKYAEHGAEQFRLPDVLKVPPISTRGNVAEIVRYFNGPEQMHQAVDQMQALLYST